MFAKQEKKEANNQKINDIAYILSTNYPHQETDWYRFEYHLIVNNRGERLREAME